MMSPRMTVPFCFVVVDEESGYRGMVVAKTTKRYTTRDQFDWPVYHPKGERAFLRVEDFGTRLLPYDDSATHWYQAYVAKHPEDQTHYEGD